MTNSAFIPNPTEPTEPTEFLRGPWDGEVHEVNVGLQQIIIPRMGRYHRLAWRRHHRDPAAMFQWRAEG